MKNMKILFSILGVCVLGAGLVWYVSDSSQENFTESNPETSEEILKEDVAKDSLGENIAEVELTKEKVAQYSTAEECWTIIDGEVYDITQYLPRHPGGMDEIMQICGKDGSALFAKVSNHETSGARSILKDYYIGSL